MKKTIDVLSKWGKMKKILIISPSLKNKGGITTVVDTIIKSNNTCSITHISTQRDGCIFIKFIYFFCSIFKLIIILLFKRIDVVHIHISERGSFVRKNILFQICKIAKKKVILHHHGAEFIQWYDSLNYKKKIKVKKMMLNVDKNIVLSKLIMNEYCNRFESIKICYIYNGVNIESNNYNSDGIYILFLGRLSSRKGVYDLIDAIKMIDDKISSKYKFLLCGDGEIDKCKRIITKYSLNDRIECLGWISKEKKKEIFSQTIINILPSYNEGMPMTILETMAYGIPNISSNVAAIPEVIDQECGILINPGDVNALSISIMKLLNDGAYRKMMSRNSYLKILKNFSDEIMIKSIFKLYYELSN